MKSYTKQYCTQTEPYPTMQALEMEEVESLVGTGRKNASLNRSKTNDAISSFAVKRDFLTKVVIVACAAMLVLLFITASDTEKEGSGTIEEKPPSSPLAPVVELANPEAPAPVANDNPPVAPPTNPPVTTPAQPQPETPGSSGTTPAGGTGSTFFEDGGYMYSKYATVVPLIDHPLPDDDTKKKLEEEWGSWHFWDGDEDIRPADDYLASYPNRDIPGDEFPEDAWQADAVFVNHYLNDADKLISRAMEAIFMEYGHGKPLPPEGKNNDCYRKYRDATFSPIAISPFFFHRNG